MEQQRANQRIRCSTRNKLGSKDLIIRMLAEVFHVNQTDDGQVKWQQVSTSLVPVNLYSRTTSKWLNYLLAASSVAAANTTSGMSPDSRDFLLLLHQFHHQNKPTLLPPNHTVDEQNLIVFQVVAHDFVEGQCRKILNVKLAQPGIRLGQAGEYFVYWKDHYQLHQATLQSSSSFTSTNSHFFTINQHQLSPSTQFHTAQPQTWGLNFASINDAKLFYDICSLNLVDLDFNSDYLKQLSLSDRNMSVCNQQQQNLNSSSLVNDANQNEQKIIRDFLNYKQRQLQIQAQKPNKSRLQQQHFCQQAQSNDSTIQAHLQESSNSKCPSCKHILPLKSNHLLKKKENEETIEQNMCPVHHPPISDLHQRQSSTLMRSRSRSTTRNPNLVTSNTNKSSSTHSLKRARSFSTPATPDLQKEVTCSNAFRQHQESSTDNERVEIHHPRCMTFMRRQRELLKKQSTESEKPQKPARGVLREVPQNPAILLNHRNTFAHHLHESSINSSQSLHTKRTPKARYMGHLNSNHPQQSNLNPHCNIAQDYTQHHNCQKDWSTEGRIVQSAYSEHQQAIANFMNNQSSLKHRSDEGESGDIDQFESLSHRNARLARAQYANSKNMKKFLSLDAGGVQSTPTQLATINQRFQHNLKTANEQGVITVIKRQSETLTRPTVVDKLNSTDQISSSPHQAHKRMTDSDFNRRQVSHEGEIGQNNRDDNQFEMKKVLPQASGSEIDASRNVSTTTDDLPLDPQTRKRMFKLTSEEVISERTEPRSLSTPSAELHDLANSEKSGRQVRAVSSGPDIDQVLRNRNARSDTGRRRSLERSMCVDLDHNTPLSQVKKNFQLSPLQQSSSPLLLGGGSSKSSPSYIGYNMVIAQQEEFLEDLRQKQAKFSTAPKRARTKSASSTNKFADCCSNKSYINTEMRSSVILDQGEAFDGSCQHQSSDRMISFKSGPEIRQNHELEDFYDQNCHNSNHRGTRTKLENTTTECYMTSEHTTLNKSTLGAKGGAYMSSYAVPLCPEDSSQGHRYPRQTHSCPSSLRRKRVEDSNQPHHQHTDDKLSRDSLKNNSLHQTIQCHCQLYNNVEKQAASIQHGEVLMESTEKKILETNCACCSNKVDAHINTDFANKCASNSNFTAICGNKSCNRQQQNHCHHHGLACMSNIPKKNSDEARGNEKRFIPTRQDCMHLSRSQYRPCSSQGSKSPLRYGLYESDCEEDIELGDFCYAQSRFDCCIPQEPINRSSSVYIRPSTFKPVQGYDQTMARASLKSRQRAKSQPPSSDSVAINSFHLSKSMENVQKLINEVQNELNLLKRQPLSLLQGIGTTRIMESEANTKLNPNDDHHELTQRIAVEPDPCAKMSKDEEGLPLHHQSESKISSSSATRRAGQFKCVGAIRKAGFLSVKKWILKRRQSIELARKQGWKRYWVCLRGTALLFHSVVDKNDTKVASDNNLNPEYTNLLSWLQTNCKGQFQMTSNFHHNHESLEEFFKNMSQCYIEKEPRHLIIIEGAIAQPIPEHPKRDHVFCLSTTFGDAYLFQASCQLESENWISSIHNACAASIARDLTRDEAMKLFETKIRHLELEAEKKLFLRQRLESRLTSMSSMSHIAALTSSRLNQLDLGTDNLETQSKKNTMRSLLHRLNQQLLALDVYLEQIHCEVYQLRCYLSSCGAQQIFYQNLQNQSASNSPAFLSIDLPHPRSLLMHVSKQTKMLLIRLGVFTVSSFHAYIHAHQGSAETILQKIQQNSLHDGEQSSMHHQSSFELQTRSNSAKLLSKHENVALETDTEKLIHITDLKVVKVRLTKKLFWDIQGQNYRSQEDFNIPTAGSDDSYSLQDDGEHVFINLKLHSYSSSTLIIKQVLNIIDTSSKLSELEFLNYYLYFTARKINELEDVNQTKGSSQYVAKKRETLKDWSNFEYLELAAKIIFRAELLRKRIDEESSPFGISIGAQLFVSNHENLLNVYCSYIEWGSVADKSGLGDDDEILMINGVPVMDLDMMFIECIIQDENKLKLVVRSCRSINPPKSKLLAKSTWRFSDRDDDEDSEPTKQGRLDRSIDKQDNNTAASGSQVISDEYISSLVCPPPPAQTSAFYRADSSLLRQKSDLSIEKSKSYTRKIEIDADERDEKLLSDFDNSSISRVSKSQQNLDSMLMDEVLELKDDLLLMSPRIDRKQQLLPDDSAALANQLVKKTEQLTQLLGMNLVESWDESAKDILLVEDRKLIENSKVDLNSIERLRKSISELLETEYAYIRHLETILEHYMNPLEDMDFLKISGLKNLSRIIIELVAFQRAFFSKLTHGIFLQYEFNNSLGNNEFEEINEIVQKLNSFSAIEDFKPLIQSLRNTFSQESEKFRIYAIYCTAYSSLQKLLHQKRNSAPTASTPSIATIPNAMDTFISSNTFAGTTTIGSHSVGGPQHREFLRPLGSFLNSNNELGMHLKQLGDFLGHLDSSSSSASSSLPKSNSEQVSGEQKKLPAGGTQMTYQKSVHQQNFESYLIKPIQRIVKYPMLLNSIALSAQVLVDAESYCELQNVVKQMESITSYVNDTQRLNDEYGFIFGHIERQLYDHKNCDATNRTNPASSLSNTPQPRISLNIGQLLHFGAVDWLNIHEFTPKFKKEVHLSQVLFVFNSCVVFICKEQVRLTKKKQPNSFMSSTQTLNNAHGSSNSSKAIQKMSTNEVIRYLSVIPVSEVQVRTVTASGQQKTDQYRWELFRCSSVNSNSKLLTKSSKRNTTGGKVYLLSSSSNEIRNAFLRKIRYIIRESVRNMSLPVPKSPSRKSLTPKKLSSPSTGTNTNSSCSHSTSLSPICDSGEHCEQIKGVVECKFTGSQVDNGNYKRTVGVNI